MKEDCLQLLTKLDNCLKDPDFQMIIIMKFMRSLAPYLKTLEEDENERSRNSV
jgi:hypothetical protein